MDGVGIERRAEGERGRLEVGDIRCWGHMVGGAGRDRRILRAGDESTCGDDGDDETCEATVWHG